MDLSIIIVNWNTKKLLIDCLKSVFKFTKGIKFEVIVVDNGSTDGSKAGVRKHFPQVHLIENKANLGFTKANNQGLKLAKGEYVLLLNSDTYLIENSLKKLVDIAKGPSLKTTDSSKSELEKPNRDGPLGAIGPLLLNTDQSIQQSVGFFPHLPQIFYWMSFIDDLPFGKYLKPLHVDHDSFYKKTQDVDWVTGAAIMVPKSVITKVGVLDEGIFMYGEEIEWCFRIKKAGFHVFFTNQAKIVHIGRGSTSQLSKRSFIGEFNGLKYFYKKYKSPFALQILKFLLKIGALARIVIFSLLGRRQLAKIYVEALKAV